MLNEKGVLVTNIFFLANKNILVLKGLDPKYIPDGLEYALFLNDSFITSISFTHESFIEKKKAHQEERAFECKQNLDQLKGVDLTLNVLRINIR